MYTIENVGTVHIIYLIYKDLVVCLQPAPPPPCQCPPSLLVPLWGRNGTGESACGAVQLI